MPTRLKLFDTSRLRLLPLGERKNDLDASVIMPLRLRQGDSTFSNPGLDTVAGRLVSAKRAGATAMMMMGGHVVRSGVQRFIIDLMEKGYLTCVAMNGAVMIHDFELSLIGATTESVPRYISSGQFGLWDRTGILNDIINAGHARELGMGEAVGEALLAGDFPGKDTSLLAQAYRLGIPATVHVGIGYDIIHQHPNFDGAAAGASSYRDFLAFAAQMEALEGGVVMNFGSAVMAPEVFLKALAMARNVAHQDGRGIKAFTTLVCDLKSMPDTFRQEPEKTSSAYYFRPWKTMLARTVADGGESFYVQGRHADTVPALWEGVVRAERELR